jgi:DNA (cytosine-5)-methyltransferase 1
MLTFGSLFAGIGGIDLGLERAGMQCAWQVEIDDYATRVLTKHWPDVPKFRDVRECGADNLSRVDLIAGGFPCQDISDAGQRRGLAGSRSGLWSEFARIIRELRPRYVLVENVAALLHRGVESVLGELAALGYDAEWQCIPAAAIGAPHLRNRLFIVAYTSSTRIRSISIQPGRQDQADSDINGCGSPLVYSDRNTARRESQSTDEAAGRRLPYLSERFSGGRGSWRIEPDVDRVAHGIPARVDRLRGLGNAVVPDVAEFVGRLIVEHERNA